VLVALVAALAWWWWQQDPAPTVAPPPSPEDPAVVAVLPWQSLQPGSPRDWLSTALGRMVAAELDASGVPRVVAGAEVERVARELGRDSWGPGRDLTPTARNLGVGRLLVGTFGSGAEGSPGMVLRLEMVDATGQPLAAAQERVGTGTEELAGAVRRLTAAVVAESGTALEGEPPSNGGAALAPSSITALEPYTRGLDELDEGDPGSARAHLLLAAAAAPESAEVQRALAETWGQLGYRQRSGELVDKALARGGDLPRRWRLRATAEKARWSGPPAAAANLYRQLRQERPRDLHLALVELRLRLQAEDAEGAALVIEELQALPEPERDDPRVDLGASALGRLRQDAEAQGRHAAAALTEARARGALTWQAAAHLALAEAALHEGRLEEADASIALARRLYRDLDDPRGQGRAALAGALAATFRLDSSGAEEQFQTAKNTFRRAGDLPEVAEVLLQRGRALEQLEQPERAAESYQEALELREELGDAVGMVEVQRARGGLLRRGGDLRGAEGALRAALAVPDLEPDPPLEAALQLELAAVLSARERFEPARQALERALELASSVPATTGASPAAGGSGALAARAHAGLAELELLSANPVAARGHQEAALALYQGLGDEESIARTRLALAALDLAAGRAAAAQAVTAGLVETFQELAVPDGLLAARVLRSRCLMALGDLAEARTVLSTAAASLGPDSPASLRLAVSLADARLVGAEGDPRRAVRILQQLLAETVTTAATGPSLEVRLALGEMELESDLAAAGRARLRAVREDAEARGYPWIAQRAEEALR
jgi:tetratricopeptide (TPR) repeat protein